MHAIQTAQLLVCLFFHKNIESVFGMVLTTAGAPKKPCFPCSELKLYPICGTSLPQKIGNQQGLFISKAKKLGFSAVMLDTAVLSRVLIHLQI